MIKFDIRMLDGYAIIEKPCTAIVKVAAKPGNLYTADGHNRWIVNLRAVTADNLELLKRFDSSFTEYSFNDISHLLMTGAIWEGQITDELSLPTKGENVIATFDYVDDVLRCTNITMIPRIAPKIFRASSVIEEAMNEFSELIKSIKDE